MKKLILSVLLVCFLVPVTIAAVDTTKQVSYYVREGFTTQALAEDALHAILDNTSSDVRTQLERRAITVPITMTSAGADTFLSPILVVPPGVNYILEYMQISCAVGATGSGVALGQVVYHTWSGDTLLVLDTLVTKVEIDADSTVGVAMAESVYTFTLLDTGLEAGELVFWRQFNEAASTTEGPCITILYKLDE